MEKLKTVEVELFCLFTLPCYTQLHIFSRSIHHRLHHQSNATRSAHLLLQVGFEIFFMYEYTPLGVWRLGFILSATHLVIALNTTLQTFLQTSNLPYFKACLLCKIRKEQCFGTDVSFPLSCHSKFHFT